MSTTPSSDRPQLLRVSTAPGYTSLSSSKSMDSSSTSSELQWLQDGNCSRPPTPHIVKRTRLLRGPSPMKLPSKTQAQNNDDTAAATTTEEINTNFPLLPNLVRAGSSRLSRKFSRRSTLDNSRQLSTSMGKNHQDTSSMEFDQLEMLTSFGSMNNQPVINHRQYGTSDQSIINRLSISQLLIDQPSTKNGGKKLNRNRRSFSAGGGRRSSTSGTSSLIDSQTTNQMRSAFLDFFRRNSQSTATTATAESTKGGFDDLSISKPALVASDPARKKSGTHAVMTMQPRSPRYGGARDRQASLPEIERLIRLSQKKRDNSMSSIGNSSKNESISGDRNIAGRVRGLKIDN